MAEESFQPDPQPRDRFAEDLGALYRSNVQIPQALDDAILTDARRHLAPRYSRRLILRIGALVTAAAAVIVIVVHLSVPVSKQNASQAPVAMTKVDIVDALKLARRIRSGQIDASQDDVNHDGAVDQHDVDAIAMAAVRLPEARVQ